MKAKFSLFTVAAMVCCLSAFGAQNVKKYAVSKNAMLLLTMIDEVMNIK